MVAESGRHESLGSHGARLPLVVLRDEVQVRLRHLDVEPEDPVVADLETLDSRALLLRRLHRRDGGATPLRQIRQIVEVRSKPGTHETGLAARRHLVDQRALEQLRQRGRRPQRGPELAQQRREAPFEPGRKRRHLAQGAAQAGEIPRRSLAHGETAEKALHVQHPAQPLRDLLPKNGGLRQLLDAVLAPTDLHQIEQRRRQPARHQPSSRRRQRPIDDRQQRPAAAPVGPVEQFQILRCARVDPEVARGLLDRDADHVLCRGALRFLHVRQRLRRRLDAERIPQAEAIQGGDAEVSLQQLLRALRIAERARLDAHGAARTAHRLGEPLVPDQHLARTDARQLVEGLLRASDRQRPQLACRGVQQRDRGALLRDGDRSEPERLAGLERVLVDQRPGRDQPHDLAPHQLLSRTGNLHLIADGHLVPGGDQAGDVPSRRVMWDSRHGNPIFSLGAGRQRDAEQLRGEAGVVVEELVEVAEPEEEERIARLRLGLVVLAEHRRDRRRRLGGDM